MTDTFAPIAIPIPALVATIKAHLAKADHSAEKYGRPMADRPLGRKVQLLRRREK
jgi:hypothetical protein